jgi:Ca2+-binding EF-hand superfamily protein
MEGELFEEVFAEQSLGFSVMHDSSNSRIVVSTVGPHIVGKVKIGDGILAVNGAPLGRASHPGILQEKLKPLSRPVVLTMVRFGEEALEGLLAKAAAEFVEAFAPSAEPGAHSPAVIADVFCRYDYDSSGDLDVFELSSAVAELWGQPPTTAQVTAMVHATGALDSNTLSLQQFAVVLATDWSGIVSEPMMGGELAKLNDVYEETFYGPTLGFGVSLDAVAHRIVVTTVGPAVNTKIQEGDGVLAVNGAPLGKVDHPAALQVAIQPLRRPLTLTFVRHGVLPLPVIDEEESGFEVFAPSTEPGAHSAEVIADVFRRYDFDSSGDLDVFELASAVSELWGQPPTTAQVTAMVHATGAFETNTLSLQQFANVLATSWLNVDSCGAAPIIGSEHAKQGDMFEETFAEASLGFSVYFDAVHTRIAVQAVIAHSGVAAAKLQAGDAILAVNGAPMGKVNSPKALQEKIKTLRRPLVISFVRGGRGAIEDAPAATPDLAVEEASGVEAFAPSIEPGAHSSEVIADVFRRYDFDSSGDLDVFELASAVSELWGQPPTTAQVTAMVHVTGALKTNTLSLQQFAYVLATDWSQVGVGVGGSVAPAVSGRDAKPGDVFECAFPHPALGFGVRYDALYSRIVVAAVGDALVGVLEIGDGVLAVNGAPLGKVNRPSALQEAVKSLRRPLTITFVRRDTSPEPLEEPEVVSAPASQPNALSAAVVADVFKRFDWDSSGDLDVFELSSAVSELWGQPPTTAQVTAMVHWSGALESNTVTFSQFEALIARDWSAVNGDLVALHGGVGASPGTVYEESFAAGPLGFGVAWDDVHSHIVVALLTAELTGRLEIGDGVLAVNGAPLGKVNRPSALQEAIKPLRRPLTITFVRHGARDAAATLAPTSTTTGLKLLRRMSLEACGGASAAATTEKAEERGTTTTPATATAGDALAATMLQVAPKVSAKVEPSTRDEDAQVASDEAAAPAMSDEAAAPVTTSDNATAAPMASDKVAAPAMSDEVAAPMASDKAAALATSEKAAAPLAASDEAAAPAMGDEAAAPMAASDKAVAPAMSDEAAAPMAKSDEAAAPIAENDDAAAPMAESDKAAAPMASDEAAAPMAESDKAAAPMASDKAAAPAASASVEPPASEVAASPAANEETEKPLVSEEAASQAESDEAAAPLVSEEAASPALSDEAAAPLLSKEAASPSESDEAAAPLVSEEAASSAESDEAAAPLVSDEAASPSESDEAEEPLVSEEAASQAESDEAAAPLLSKEAASPAASKEAEEPLVSKEAASPSESDEAAEPLVSEEAASQAESDEAAAPLVSEEAASPLVSKQAALLAASATEDPPASEEAPSPATNEEAEESVSEEAALPAASKEAVAPAGNTTAAAVAASARAALATTDAPANATAAAQEATVPTAEAALEATVATVEGHTDALEGAKDGNNVSKTGEFQLKAPSAAEIAAATAALVGSSIEPPAPQSPSPHKDNAGSSAPAATGPPAAFGEAAELAADTAAADASASEAEKEAAAAADLAAAGNACDAVEGGGAPAVSDIEPTTPPMPSQAAAAEAPLSRLASPAKAAGVNPVTIPVTTLASPDAPLTPTTVHTSSLTSEDSAAAGDDEPSAVVSSARAYLSRLSSSSTPRPGTPPPKLTADEVRANARNWLRESGSATASRGPVSPLVKLRP